MKKTKYPCPVCGALTLEEEYDICPVCNWEDNDIQRDNPDWDGSANEMSLNEAREYWKKYKKPIP